MGKTNLGRVSVAPRGAYNNETSYKRLDVVEYEGSSYLFLKDSTGIIPTADGEVTMLLAKKGKEFAYEDFTPEQLAALKGADGNNGVNGSDGTKGDKGEPGKGFTILGYYGTLDLLEAAVPTPEPGDAYGIGTAAPYDIYVFDGVTNDWVNNGKLSGGGESGGNVVLIPAEVMGLSSTSTSEEILHAFEGKEAFMDVVTRVKEGATVTIKQVSGDGVLIYTLVNFNAYISQEQGVYQFGFTFINSLPDGKENVFCIFILQNDVIQLVEKEVTPLGYANIVSIPPDVMSLSNESTSEQILTAFGGKPVFDAIVEKVRASKAVGIIASNAEAATVQLNLHEYTDIDNLKFNIRFSVDNIHISIIVDVINGVFCIYNSMESSLLQTDLISDPAMGGTDKPASAEAVKKVNESVIRVHPDAVDTRDENNLNTIYSWFGVDSASGLAAIASNVNAGITKAVNVRGYVTGLDWLYTDANNYDLYILAMNVVQGNKRCVIYCDNGVITHIGGPWTPVVDPMG